MGLARLARGFFACIFKNCDYFCCTREFVSRKAQSRTREKIVGGGGGGGDDKKSPQVLAKVCWGLCVRARNANGRSFHAMAIVHLLRMCETGLGASTDRRDGGFAKISLQRVQFLDLWVGGASFFFFRAPHVWCKNLCRKALSPMQPRCAFRQTFLPSLSGECFALRRRRQKNPLAITQKFRPQPTATKMHFFFSRLQLHFRPFPSNRQKVRENS